MIAESLRTLVFSYAPKGRRAALEALFALDAALGQVLRTTREPMVGQLRLAWWRDALARLDEAPPPGEPVLQALAEYVLPLGVTGKEIAGLADGWEQLLGAPLNVFVLQRHAILRGAKLFGLAAGICGTPMNHRIDMVARGWAFADLAGHLGDRDLARTAREMASIRLPSGRQRPRWPNRARAIGGLALIAGRGLTGDPPSSFVLRLAWFRLTGF